MAIQETYVKQKNTSLQCLRANLWSDGVYATHHSASGAQLSFSWPRDSQLLRVPLRTTR